MPVTFIKDHSLDQKKKVLCQSCKNSTNHIVLCSIEEKGSGLMHHDPDELFHWSADYEVIKCLGCETISFRVSSSNSEDYDYEGRPIETVKVYPKRSEDSWPFRIFWNAPLSIKRIYRETVFSYDNDNLTLCAAGIRALVEGVCKSQGVKGGNVEIERENGIKEKKFSKNLQGKINGLYENGKLTKSNANILHYTSIDF